MKPLRVDRSRRFRLLASRARAPSPCQKRNPAVGDDSHCGVRTLAARRTSSETFSLLLVVISKRDQFQKERRSFQLRNPLERSHKSK
jgi:hypothetical protein